MGHLLPLSNKAEKEAVCGIARLFREVSAPAPWETPPRRIICGSPQWETGWGHRVFSGLSSEPGTPHWTGSNEKKRKNTQTHKHPYLTPFLFCSKTSGHLSGSRPFFFFLIFKYLFICLHRDLIAAHDLLSSCSVLGSLVVVLKLSYPETQGILVP